MISKLQLRVTPEVFRDLKMAAAITGLTMSALVTKWVEEFLAGPEAIASLSRSLKARKAGESQTA